MPRRSGRASVLPLVRGSSGVRGGDLCLVWEGLRLSADSPVAPRGRAALHSAGYRSAEPVRGVS